MSNDTNRTTFLISSSSSLKASATEDIQNFRNFSFNAFSFSLGPSTDEGGNIGGMLTSTGLGERDGTRLSGGGRFTGTGAGRALDTVDEEDALDSVSESELVSRSVGAFCALAAREG